MFVHVSRRHLFSLFWDGVSKAPKVVCHPTSHLSLMPQQLIIISFKSKFFHKSIYVKKSQGKSQHLHAFFLQELNTTLLRKNCATKLMYYLTLAKCLNLGALHHTQIK